MTPPALELREVWKSFDGQEVLRGVNLSIPTGTTYVLLGRSGSGKTVLLKHAAGLLHPDRGQVLIDGEDLAGLSTLELQRVREKLGVLFQGGALFDSLDVFHNVAFPLEERGGFPARKIAARVEEVLHLVGLEGAAGESISNLSGGMQKRVALARAIVLEPKLLLDDDPTAGLDPILSDHVAGALVSLREKLGVSSLIITHDLPLAFRAADQIGLLHEGVIVEASTPGRFQQSGHPAVRAFLHDWRKRRAGKAG